jgi:glutaredoxin
VKKKKIGSNRKAPTLRIYVAEHCWACEEAKRLAEEVGRRFVHVNLELIDMEAEGSRNLDDVFSVPTYVLDGRMLSLGNPRPDELFTQIEQALA